MLARTHGVVSIEAVTAGVRALLLANVKRVRVLTRWCCHHFFQYICHKFLAWHAAPAGIRVEACIHRSLFCVLALHWNGKWCRGEPCGETVFGRDGWPAEGEELNRASDKRRRRPAHFDLDPLNEGDAPVAQLTCRAVHGHAGCKKIAVVGPLLIKEARRVNVVCTETLHVWPQVAKEHPRCAPIFEMFARFPMINVIALQIHCVRHYRAAIYTKILLPRGFVVKFDYVGEFAFVRR